MAYSQLADIQERIPEDILLQLTDDDDTVSVDEAKVNAAITRADSEIDAWCSGRYAVPFATVPPIIAELSADLATYYLYSRRQEIIPEARSERYRANQALLKAISAGQVQLPGAASAKTGSTRIEVTSNDRLFNRGSLKGGF
jgi:phage gp36-like protein